MTHLIKAAALGLLLLAGCTTLTVQTDYDTSYDFSTLKTYAWLEGKPPSNDIRINNSLIINRVVNAVNHNLQVKGYRRVGKDKADFFVNWFGGIENKIQQETIDTYYGYLGYYAPTWGYRGYWPGYLRTYTYEYQEGTLIVDIADSKSKQLIWRGTGQDYIDKTETPGQITANINHTIAKILEGFPPGNRKGAIGP